MPPTSDQGCDNDRALPGPRRAAVVGDGWQPRAHLTGLRLFGLTFILCAALTGCGSGGVYPVEGQVVWKDGAPAKNLAGSLVFFELPEKQTSSRGSIQPDGSFQLTTNKQNDGAPAGEHTVLIIEIGRKSLGGPDSSAIAPGKIDTRYATPSSSDLRASVKPERNKITLTVEPPK